MFDLLSESHYTWPEVIDEDREPNFWGPLVDDLASAQGRCLIGWDHHPVDGPERLYYFSLVRWVAIQIGRRMRRFRSEGLNLKKSVPYIVHDGLQTIPVFIDSEWSTGAPGSLCDRYGVPLGPQVLRELAWHHIPMGAHSVISATHHGRSIEEIRQAFVTAGTPGATKTIRTIRGHIARLDVLWSERDP